MSGDYMAEDPLCTHEVGTYVPAIKPPQVEYGTPAEPTIPWDADASDRMQRVPAFVRGMVVRAVESHCRKNSIPRVTLEELDRIRSRMPTPKVFSRGGRPS